MVTRTDPISPDVGGQTHTHSMIEVRGLVKRYGNFTAVKGIDLDVRPNEIFGILGPNGAGKTTSLEMIEGLRDPDEGTILVNGIDITTNADQVKRQIGVQLQTTSLFDHLSIRELISLFTSLYNIQSTTDHVDRLIKLVSLEEKEGSSAKELSGGQQQRLSIALALVNDPTIVFLDEPTTGLDPQARRSLWDVIRNLRNEGKTIVLTTHYMEEAETLCDRVAVMDNGEIIACDTPLALVQSLDQVATVRARVNGQLETDRLEQLPGVMNADIVDGQLQMQTEDVQATLSALLRIAGDLEIRLDNLTTSSANLEDVFLAYTGRSLRE